MAVAIVTGTPVTKLRIEYIDVNLQPQTEYLELDLDPGDVVSVSDGGLTPAGVIEKLLTDLGALGNTAIVANAERITNYTITGTVATPILQPLPFVSSIASLAFQRRNPLKPASLWNVSFVIPAPIVSAVGAHGGLVQAPPNSGSLEAVGSNANLADLVSILNNHLLAKSPGNGQYYGGFTYVPQDSKVLSLPDITDNE